MLKIGVDVDKLPANMMEYGNTSAASVPILLSEYVDKGYIKLDGSQTVLFSAFGGGLTWGSLIVKSSYKLVYKHKIKFYLYL